MNVFWIRIIQTVLALAAIFCAGLNDGALGATLPDLAFLTSSPPARLAQLYTWRALASILGSMLFGHLNDVVGGPLVLGLCLLGQGSMSLLTPWCPELAGLSIIQAISAFFTNGIVTANYALTFLLWKSSVSASLIQATRLTFSVGLAVAPVAIGSFLGVQPQDITGNFSSSDPLASNCRVTGNSTGCTDLYLVYSTFGGIDISLGVLAFIVACTVKAAGDRGLNVYGTVPEIIEDKTRYTKEESKRNDVTKTDVARDEDTPVHISLLDQFKRADIVVPYSFILLGMILYGGIEMVMVGLLVTYTEVYIGWSVRESVVLLTVYQTVKLLTILPIIYIAKVVRPFKILLADVVLIAIAAILFLAVIEYSDVAIWLSTVLIALGASNVFATVLSYAHDIVPLSGKLAGGFNVAFSVGGMTMPVLCGYLLENFGLISYPAVLTVCSILLVVTVVTSRGFLYYYCRKNDQSRDMNKANEKSPLLLSANLDN